MRKIDPEGKHPGQDVVELAGRLEVVAERLLHDHASPLVRDPVGEAVLLQLADTVPKNDGGMRGREGHVAAGAAQLVELLDGASQLVEGVVVVEVARTKRKPSESWFQTSSRNGVRACSLTASWTICAKSWSAQSRRRSRRG